MPARVTPTPRSSSEPARERADDAAPTRADNVRAALRGHALDEQVQMLAPGGADGSASSGDVHAAARRGVAGGGGALPHLDSVQRAFGGHDVSGVQAHVGGQAREATRAMGASAYASGDHVAFGGSPDLHTAAHEAAHVVQQRADVSLPGGVGASGDGYEQQADKVADAVVRGDSAEALLGPVAGGGGRGGAVQRKTIAAVPGPAEKKDEVEDKPKVEDKVEDKKDEKKEDEKPILETRTIDSKLLEEKIAKWNPSPDELLEIGKLLSKLDDTDNVFGELEKLLIEVAKLEGPTGIADRRAFVGVYNSKKSLIVPTKEGGGGKPPKLLLGILLGVLKMGKQQRESKTEINVGGDPFKGKLGDEVKNGMQMDVVEKTYDTLCRKSSAPPPHAVHEVDVAMLPSMRGFSDVRASLGPNKDEAQLSGGDSRGEKTFAVGHSAALGFKGKLSTKGGERFYAVLFPKGFLAHYGEDLKTKGANGKSAPEPNEKEMAERSVSDGGTKGGKVGIGKDKAFAIRAEDATKEKGQVDVHFAWQKMDIHGKKMSQVDFFRMSAVGAVEFDDKGDVLNTVMFG